ncbi:hypothetical protein HDU97_009726 [Phlyctochytrium planicorne]|nr:hypothetical protein HDU97_009726 [Phlyctochytrium planicorne]
MTICRMPSLLLMLTFPFLPLAVSIIPDTKLSVLSDTGITIQASQPALDASQFYVYISENDRTFTYGISNGSIPSLEMVFRSPGLKRVSFLLATTNLTGLEAATNWISALDGNVDSVTAYSSTAFYVSPDDECFHFDHSIYWSSPLFDVSDSNDVVRVEISLKSSKQDSFGSTDEILSLLYQRMGEPPRGTLFNDTNHLDVTFQTVENSNRWFTLLANAYFESSTPLLLRISPLYSSFLGCKIKEAFVNLSKPYAPLLSLGLPLWQKEKLPLASFDFGSDYAIDDLIYSNDPCTIKNAIIYLSPKPRTDLKSTGGLVIATDDALNSDIILIDLFRDADGLTNTAGSICQNSSKDACRNAKVLGVALTYQSTIVFATTGLFYLDPESQVPGERAFRKISVANAKALNGNCSTVRNIQDISSLEAAFFIDVERDFDNDAILYLVGLSGDRKSGAPGLIVIEDRKSQRILSQFQFPESFLVLGISFHANNVDLFAYGSELWRSIDRGRTWSRIYSLEGNIQMITKFRSFSSGEYFCITNLSRILYGRVSSLVIVELVNLWQYEKEPLDVFEGEKDTFYSISVDTRFIPNQYGSTEIGKLYQIRKKVFAIAPTLQATEPVAPCDLAYRPVGKAKAEFRSYGTNSCFFSESQVGLNFTHYENGNGVVTSVSEARREMTVLVSDSFKPDVEVPAISFDLTISQSTLPELNSGDVTAVNIDLVIPGTLLDQGWRICDMGKTIVTDDASILIVKILAPANAIGLTSNSPYKTYKAGSWSVFNFAAIRNVATNRNQNLTVSKSSENEITLSLDGGQFKFTQNPVDSDLKARAWCIAKYSSAVQSKQCDLQTLALVLAPEKWAVHEQSPILDTSLPDSWMARNWKLEIPSCGVNREEALSALYLKFHGLLNVKNDVKLKKTNLASFEPSLTGILTNPSLFATNVTSSKNSHSGIASLQLSLQDLGAQGSITVSFRPGVESLKCPTKRAATKVASLCPSTRKLVYVSHIGEYELLHGNSSFFDGLSEVETLPENYRPPSYLGKSVPLSPNIYNANPGAPRFRDRYAVSKSTGSFKKCNATATQKNCTCTTKDKNITAVDMY